MHNLVLSPIDPEKLITDISERVTANILNAVQNNNPTTNNPEQWLDLNELIQYDPEKRTKPTWYSKISRNEVPHYKRGKKVYFLKSEIDDWLKQGKCKSNIEIEKETESYLALVSCYKFNRSKIVKYLFFELFMIFLKIFIKTILHEISQFSILKLMMLVQSLLCNS